MAGLIADELDSYTPAFYVAGSEVFLAACITFLLCFFKPSRQRAENIEFKLQDSTGEVVPLHILHRISGEKEVDDKITVHHLIVELRE